MYDVAVIIALYCHAILLLCYIAIIIRVLDGLNQILNVTNFTIFTSECEPFLTIVRLVRRRLSIAQTRHAHASGRIPRISFVHIVYEMVHNCEVQPK